MISPTTSSGDGIAAGAAHQRAKARDELGDGERLRQIVVGAKIERLDAIVDGIERGQNQHRRARARLPQILQQRPAAALRHHQIEHDRIVGHFAEHELRFFAVGSDVDGKVRLAERTAQRARQIGLILDDEHSHGFGGVAAPVGVLSVSSSMRKSSNMTVESPRGPQPDAGAGARQAIALAEDADAAEVHADLARVPEALFNECHASGSSSRSSSRSRRIRLPLTTRYIASSCFDEIELRRVVVHRILIFPDQARRTPAAGRLEAHRHLDVLILRAGKNATAKLSAGDGFPSCTSTRALPSRLTVQPSAAASRPAADHKSRRRRADLVVVERAQDDVLRRHGSLEKHRQHEQQHGLTSNCSPAT